MAIKESLAATARRESETQRRPNTSHRPPRREVVRRSSFQRWLAESRTQEVSLDQRMLDLCG
jgi:hypothetical protein